MVWDNGQRTLAEGIWEPAGALPRGSLSVVSRRGSEQRPYADLLESALATTAELAGSGVEPGDHVGVVAAASFDLVPAVLAVWRLGAVVVLIGPPPRLGAHSQWRALARAQLRHASASIVVDASGQLESWDDLVTLRVAGSPARGDVARIEVEPHSPAVITFTSGSTAAPQGIVASHHALATRVRSLAGWGAGLEPEHDHRLSWMPLHQWNLFATVLHPMMHGVGSTLMPTSLFMADPGRWLLEISRSRATYSAGPNFAYGQAARQLELGLPEPVDLSCWTLAQCAGEAVDHETLERFAKVAQPCGFDPGALRPAYGLSEAGGVAGRPPGSGLRVDRVDRRALGEGHAAPAGSDGHAATFSSVGPPWPGFRLRIVDADGADCAERHVGEVLVAGPLMDGYLDDPDATAAVLRGGWLHTGDLGYLADGELFVTGRAKDVIIVNGRNYHATDIERLAGHGAIAFAVPGGATEALVLVVEAVDPEPSLTDHIRRTVHAHTGITPADVVIVPPGAIPRTEQGKPQRATARGRYVDSTLSGP